MMLAYSLKSIEDTRQIEQVGFFAVLYCLVKYFVDGGCIVAVPKPDLDRNRVPDRGKTRTGADGAFVQIFYKIPSYFCVWQNIVKRLKSRIGHKITFV